jgi:hypothetical protein
MTYYDETPSFYNNDEMFEKYLGKTSYYLALQDSVLKITKMINPDNILEIWSGLGQTTIKIFENNKNSNILAIDNRKKPIEKSRQKIDEENVKFVCNDMVKYIQKIHSLPKLTIMLYSFHHIPDPVEIKVSFLENCYKKMNKGDYLCIAEAFIPEDELKLNIRSLWEKRGLEGYASTFWNSLGSLEKEDINNSKEVGNFTREHEIEAGNNVKDRNNEYLVTENWLVNTSENIGFDVIISEPCNAFNDKVILLQK